MTALAASLDQSRWSMFEGRDVPWLLRQWVERTPHKPFLVWEPFDRDPETWTYAELDRDVEAVAGAMYKRGVRPGDRVMLHLDNSPEFVIAWFACARLGAVAVSTNTRSVARDMAYFAENAGIVAAITQPKFADLVHGCAERLKFLAIAETDAGEPADAPAVAHVPFAEFLAETARCPERPADPRANLGIQFTSGTTSRPKGVLWTHANAVWGAQLNALHMRLGHSDVTQVFLPLFHTNAQSYSMLGSLWVGGTMVVQPKFSASRFWPVALRNKCTWVSLVPFCVKALMAQEKPERHWFRFWGPAVHLDVVMTEFGIPTYGWWGMTETITQGIVGDIDHRGPEMCIGRVSPGYDIAIRRPDGSHIGPGERGRLYIRGVRGVSLFKEYWANPEATAAAFDADGWFDTGDVVVMEEDGNLLFGDRDKDMLRVGAENVAASEVETVIQESGLVEENAVVGQPHPMLDEVPVAFVVRNASSPPDLKEPIIAHCAANLPDFKVVRDVIEIDVLPRGTLEKIDKKALRLLLPEPEEA